MTITIDAFDKRSFEKAIRQLNSYQKSLERKASELANRLADYGLLLAQVSFEGTQYTGHKDVTVTKEPNDSGYTLRASGMTALILEFGAGVTYSNGHPEEEQFGMGVGTYPGQTHAFSPNGWTLPKSAGIFAGEHTYGNPASRAMYNAEKDMEREIEQMAREVFE